MNVYLPLQVDVFIFYHQELWCQFFPERIYNSNYSKEGAGNVYLLVLSSWKVNIVENPIAVMGLQIRSGLDCGIEPQSQMPDLLILFPKVVTYLWQMINM